MIYFGGNAEDVEYKSGDIIVHNNQIAYQLRFDVKVTLSVLLDREGNCISATVPGDIVERIDADSSVGADIAAGSPQEQHMGSSSYEEAMVELDATEALEKSATKLLPPNTTVLA